MNNLGKRVLTAIVFVIVLLGSIQIEWGAILLVALLIILCQKEFYNFFKPTNARPQTWYGIFCGLSFFLIAVFRNRVDDSIELLFCIVPLIFGSFIIELYRNLPNPIQNISYTLLGVIYLAVPLTLFYELFYYNDFEFTNDYNNQLIIG